MATPWPDDTIWPPPIPEHAAKLNSYLQTALQSIDNANGQAIEPRGVRAAFIGILSLIVKLQNVPSFDDVCNAVANIRTEIAAATETSARLHNETRAAIETATQTTNNLREELNNANKTIQKNTIEIRENTNATKAASIMAKETVEAGKMTLKIARDMKTQGPMNQGSAVHTYASIAARGGLAASIHNPQNQRTSQMQSLREIIVNIRDPATIASLRAMSPRNLKTHIDHAIEQSNNEHINKLKAVSANQLKSGDLSIKTATTADMEALRQFAEDWESRIGNAAAVRIPTYGVLAHGIRTTSMDMERFTELRDELLQDNRPFIPTAEIKYIGWLTRSASTKSASSVIIEFSKAQDANKIIDEGLIWQGEVFQCERYDRQCRLRQCFRCHKYGHIGTQCKATTTCGYCAQEHATRECPVKNDPNTPRKCAACDGDHEAWHSQCPTRKREMNRVKEAYKSRPRYHPEHIPIPTPAGADARPKTTTRIGRPALGPSQSQGIRPDRSRSPTKKIQKRPNPTSSQRNDENAEDTIRVAGDDARPKRNIIPSRRVLEALDVNIQPTHDSNRMEIVNIDE